MILKFRCLISVWRWTRINNSRIMLIRLSNWIIFILIDIYKLLWRSILFDRIRIFFLRHHLRFIRWIHDKLIVHKRLFFRRTFYKLTFFIWIFMIEYRKRFRICLKVNIIIIFYLRCWFTLEQRIYFWFRIFIIKILCNRLCYCYWLRKVQMIPLISWWIR